MRAPFIRSTAEHRNNCSPRRVASPINYFILLFPRAVGTRGISLPYFSSEPEAARWRRRRRPRPVNRRQGRPENNVSGLRGADGEHRPRPPPRHPRHTTTRPSIRRTSACRRRCRPTGSIERLPSIKVSLIIQIGSGWNPCNARHSIDSSVGYSAM